MIRRSLLGALFGLLFANVALAQGMLVSPCGAPYCGPLAVGVTPALVLPPGSYSFSYLAVAGGGSGNQGASSFRGAGGAAGGYKPGTAFVAPGQVLTVTVGNGGTAPGGDGTASIISGAVTGTVTADGGGAGGPGNVSSPASNGHNGGSGGGGGSANSGSGVHGSGVAGEGNDGGDGTQTLGGGGGGAGAAASTKNGGAGLSSSITGSAVTRAGGGGGGATGTVGSGGAGGGGGGSQAGVGVAGTANTGGGGGGGLTGGGNGGTGVVILSIPTVNYTGTVTGAPTVTTSGANTIVTFTVSGSYTG